MRRSGALSPMCLLNRGDQHTCVKLTDIWGDQHTCVKLTDIWGDQHTSVKFTDIWGGPTHQCKIDRHLIFLDGRRHPH